MQCWSGRFRALCVITVTGIQVFSAGNSCFLFLIENSEKQIISILLAVENCIKTYSSHLFQVAQTTDQVRDHAE